MPEENQLAGNLLQTKEEADRKAAMSGKEPESTQPVYNPLLGISRRQFFQMMAGDNTEAPLVTTDKYGTPKFHVENMGKGGPAKVKVGSFGDVQVQGQQEAMQKNMEALGQDLLKLHTSVAPELARDKARSSYFNESLQAVPNFIGEAGKSGGSIIMHGIHGILAQKRNFDELRWDITKSNNADDPDFQAAGAVVKQLEDQGRTVETLDIEDLDVSQKTKDYLYQYRNLEESRMADERRMRIAMAYDEDKTNIQQWMEGTKVLKPLGGDENSTINMISKMSGNVAGSVAVFWLGGRLLGRAGAAAAKANVERAAGQGAAATLAANGGADAALTMAANIGEKFVFWPSFLSQYDQIRTEALLSGKSLAEANAIGFIAGMAEGGLEYAGFKWFKRFYTDGGWFRNYIIRNVVPEALQEGSQTLAENAITQSFGITDKQWTDIMTEVGLSMVAGAMGGGAFSFWRAKYLGAEAYVENIAENLQDKWKGLSKDQIRKSNAAVDVVLDAVEGSEANKGNDYMAVFAENAAKNEDQSVEEALKTYRTLSAEEKTGAKAYLDAYSKLKDYYTKRAKEKNPDITEAQLKNGWKAIRVMAAAQRDNNALVSAFNKGINQMAAYMDIESKTVEQNTAKVQEILKGKGYTDEQIAQITSPDAMQRNEAGWNAATDFIVAQAQRAGVSEAEGKLMANFVKSIAYDATLLNQTSPLEIVQKMGANLINVQHAVLHGQELPELFRAITDNIDKTRFENIPHEQIMRQAGDIVSSLEADEITPEMARQVASTLYGNADIDPELKKTKSTVFAQAEMIGKVLDHMPLEIKQDLGQADYRTMSLMRSMGMYWDEILKQYQIKPNTKKNIDAVFNEKAEELFPALDSEQLRKLDYISDGAMDADEMTSQAEDVDAMLSTDPATGQPMESTAPAYNEEETANMQEGSGFYEPDINAIVLVNPKAGTALHEFGHFSLTYFVTSATALERMGLLSDLSPVHRTYAYLREAMKREGYSLTEEQLQETLLDAVNDFITKGQTEDPILTGLVNEMKADGIKRYKRLANSLYGKQGGKKETQITEEQKTQVKGIAASMLENITPAKMMADAYALREESSFRTLPEDLKQAQSAIGSWADRVEAFAKQYPGINDMHLIAIREAKAKGDVVALARIANAVATEAIGFATDAFIEGKTVSTDDELTRGTTNVFFERELSDSSKDYISTFRKETSAIDDLKQLKDGHPFKEGWGLLVNGAKNFFQSLEGAAGEVAPELRSVLMHEFHDYGMRVQKFRESAKPMVDALDKHMKKFNYKTNAYQVEAKDWQQHFHLVLRNGQKGAYKEAGDFLEKKLGKEARKSWDESIKLLIGATDMMKLAGVSAEVLAWEGDFFPFAVKDYKRFTQEYLGHNYTFSTNEKERQRFIDDYKKKHPEETEENMNRLWVALVDNQNSLMQRNVNVEQKVTSFFKRRVTRVEDPGIMEFYRDPFDCLDKYMESAYRTVMMRNLVGRVTYNQEGQPILFSDDGTNAGKVGAILAKLPEGAVPTDVLNGFVTKMRYLAQRDASEQNTLLDIVRQVNQITTLGSVFNAMNQVLDLQFCYTLFGAQATNEAIKQVMSGSAKSLTLEDVGALTNNEAFRIQDEQVLNKVAKLVYSKTGFEWTDRKVKEVILNAASNYAKNTLGKIADPKVKMTKELAQERKQLQYIIDECFPPANALMFDPTMTDEQVKQAKMERDARREHLMKVLRNGGIDENGNWGPDAKYVFWYMLTKLQPINAATVPANYNRMGALGKMMYQFSTVAIRQLGFVGDYWKMQEKIGGKLVAAKGMLKFMAFCAAIGVPNDVLQDILKGREPDVLNSFAFSPLHVMMINEYTMHVLMNEGPVSFVNTTFSPKFGALDNMAKDAFRMVSGKTYKGYTFKNVPIFGWAMWEFMFGGLDQKIKQGTDIFGRTQNPEAARIAKDTKRQAQESLDFMEVEF